MKELLKKQTTFTRIEFWAICSLYAFIIFFFVSDCFDRDAHYDNIPYKRFFDEAKVSFDFIENYFLPQVINHIITFCFVLYLNFVLIPKLIAREAIGRNIFLLVTLFVIIGCIFGVTETYLKGYKYAGNKDKDDVNVIMFTNGFENAWLIIWLLIIYTGIKYAGIYLLGISEKIVTKYKFIRTEAIVATIIWMIALFLLRIAGADGEMIVGTAIVGPSTIGFYLFAFHTLIPTSLSRRKGLFIFYLLKSALTCFIGFFVIFLLFTIIFGDSESGAEYSAFNSFFQFFITSNVTWVVYKRLLRGNEEIKDLQKELKRSSANVDFLRSQINPHFLFNALNTLYGTAIQENADRTSEAIQKLGDMMRFMLQENMQDKISLVREIEYLNNYIDLQKLRIGSNTNIQIQTEIQDHENYFQIAPMLLIPFVENAFKHGISFREPSHIKVTLEIKDNTLYFDVYNSKHPKTGSDPEKDKSGIGLENVKQRLKLSYPGTHDLIIRDTTKEFFVHLTIQLSKFS